MRYFSRVILKIMIVVFFLLLCVYGLLWLMSFKRYDIEYGISFDKRYTQSLGLDWKRVYLAMMEELKPKYIRIAAAWNEVEAVEGVYDFQDVDWMMGEARKFNAQVILVVGQKAPRWPECHVPEWAGAYGDELFKERLTRYIKKTVERYKANKALEIWQIENEPFIKFRFGNCANYRKEFVEDEIEFVRSLDPARKIMITDSGELSTWRKAGGAGDYFGTTLYRIVRTPGGRIWTYDWLPAAIYRWKAKFWRMNMNNVFVSELQAEPWFADGGAMSAPIAIQEETMNPKRLKKHLEYVKHIGVPRAYLWGVEWWYWMKSERDDGRYWDIIRKEMAGRG